MKLKLTASLLVLSAALVIVSCGPKQKKEDGKGFEDAQKSLDQEVKDIANCIPKPSEIPYLIQASGAEFNQSLVNDRRKADGYASQSDKAAMNLGGYFADIGYLSSYEKTQEAISHLAVCKTLADKLGVSATVDPNIIKKFEKNIGDKDRIAQLLDSVSSNTGELLKQGNQKLASLMVTGSFVEGMYIATGIVKTYPKDLLPDDKRNLILTPIIQHIIKQECSVSEVVKVLSGVDQTGSVPTILTDLKSLEASFKNLANLKGAIAKGDPKATLNDQTLAEITKVVEKLRGDMTN